VTTKGPKAVVNRGSRREPLPGRCLCSRRQRNQLQRKA